MSSKKPMRPPYYILINDSDLKHIKFYHDYHFANVQYENEYGDLSYDTAAIIKTPGTSNRHRVHIGPKRMHYIETALKFRDKISKIKELPFESLKIVSVEKSLKNTIQRIKEQSLEPVIFLGIWK